VADHITERMLAFHCLRLVRQFGGVLEQPAFSGFWQAANLPRPGLPPVEGSPWSLAVNQGNWQHRHAKPTWLYLVGIDPCQVAWSGFTLELQGVRLLSRLTPGQRSATPARFASWLLALACQARRPKVSCYHD
jgi:hypothetical protein